MIELTTEQRAALQKNGTELPLVIDPATNIRYVLVREEIYQRLHQLLETEGLPQSGYALADETFAEDWNDPKMAEYDNYEERKR